MRVFPIASLLVLLAGILLAHAAGLSFNQLWQATGVVSAATIVTWLALPSRR